MEVARLDGVGERVSGSKSRLGQVVVVLRPGSSAQRCSEVWSPKPGLASLADVPGQSEAGATRTSRFPLL